MTYASGGTIQAADYNSLATTLNSVWSTYYGQTAVTTALTAGTTVTAAQWSTLIGALNNALAHQSGTAAITLPVAGNTITYLASVANGVNTAVTNKYAKASQGGTTTGGNFAVNPVNGNTTTAYGPTTIITRTVTFSSAAAASYFFSAGGYLNFVISSVTNNGGTTAGADLATLLQSELGGISNFNVTTNGGRLGTGGTLVAQNTALGYTTSSTSPQIVTNVASTTASYTSDNAQSYVAVNGAVVTFYVNLQQGAHTFASSWNITVNHRVDIVFPETTYLGNSWGTPTIA